MGDLPESTPETRASDATNRRTIADFGEQWTVFRDNSAYYGSTELLADIFGPLLAVEALAGRHVADIGAGTGRIVNMLLDAGAAHVTAVEPSLAFDVLARNVASRSQRVRLLHGRGEDLPLDQQFDVVVSIGVLHHVTDPRPIVRTALQALRPGGVMLIWLYGREGNGAFLALAEPLRAIAKRLPHSLLAALCYPLNWLVGGYMRVCKILPFRLPLRTYLIEVFGRLAADKRRLVIYDQLNPAYARYYTEAEARALLQTCGFDNVRLHHRHGYSWTVAGERPLGNGHKLPASDV